MTLICIGRYRTLHAFLVFLLVTPSSVRPAVCKLAHPKPLPAQHKSSFHPVFWACLLRCPPDLLLIVRTPNADDHTTILLAGDVQPNPGPTRLPCGMCSKAVRNNQLGIFCENCCLWFHCRCASITRSELVALGNSPEGWVCPDCSRFPFQDVSLPGTPSRDLSSTLPGDTSCSAEPASRNCSIKCFSTNARSVLNKRPELQSLAAPVSHSGPPTFDVLFISETHLDSSILDGEILPPTFSILRSDRNRRGGGVLIATSVSLRPRPRPDLASAGVEGCWCEIHLESNRFLLGCIYRPPHSLRDYDDLISSHLESIGEIVSSFDGVFLCGDLNLVGTRGTTHPLLDSWCNIIGGTQLVTFPTRPFHADTLCGNTLDVVITNRPDLVNTISCVPGLGGSDHLGCEFSVTAEWRPSTERKRIYSYSKTDVHKLRTALDDLPRSNIIDTEDPNASWDRLVGALVELRQAHVPSHTTRCSSRSQWISKELKNDIRKKNRMFRDACRAKASNKLNAARLWSKYKLLRNTLTRKLKKSHDDHLTLLATRHGSNNSRDLWNHFKSMSATPYPHSFFLGDPTTPLTKPADIANTFNSHFFSSFTDDSTLNPTLPTHCVQSDIVMPEFSTSPEEVWEGIKNLPTKKAAGPDQLSPVFLKLCGPALASAFSTIFNSSLSSGIVPDAWKLSSVVPLHKKGNLLDINNYRAISLYSIPAKILERIFLRRLEDHFSRIECIPTTQHGFRKHKSCVTQIAELHHDIASLLDLKNPPVVDAIFIDWQKAFDSVSHTLLLRKLEQYGLSGNQLAWVRSFLSGRTQFVAFRGAKSTSLPVNSGVPQGSVLGPFLFSVFIADIPMVILHSAARFYADDTAIYRPIHSPLDRLLLQKDLDRLSLWCTTNALPLNLNKCVVVHFTRKRHLPHSTYTISDHPLDVVQNVKYLGVIFSSDLSWKPHVTHSTNKASRISGFIRRNIKHTGGDLRVHKLLYLTMCRSVLTYAVASWSPSLQYQIISLEQVQRRFTRAVCRSELGRHPSYPERLDLFHIPSVRKFCDYSALSFVAGQLYCPASQLANQILSVSPRSTSLRFLHIYARCEAMKNSTFVSFPRAFNLLPSHVRDALLHSNVRFQIELKNALLRGSTTPVFAPELY